MLPDSPPASVRLNLGCGQNPMPGYVNVDKYGSPDLKWDLEQFPWPWADSSVDEIVLHHVLEHLGKSTRCFFEIVKQLYRVCKHGAVIQITIPDPRHDSFLSDPTNVRAFTPHSFLLFSKAMNHQWQKENIANSPLALYLDVDFNVSHLQYDLEQPWAAQYDSRQLTQQQIQVAATRFNNVIKQFNVRLIANKPPVSLGLFTAETHTLPIP